MPELVIKVVKGVLEKLGGPALHVADKPVDLQLRVTGIKEQLTEHGGSIVLGCMADGVASARRRWPKPCTMTSRRNLLTPTASSQKAGDADDAKLQELQRQMLKELCGIALEVSHGDSGRQQLELRMGSRRVLLVIDDVWSSAQLDALLVSFAPGSRVLVTTRSESLLAQACHSYQPAGQALERVRGTGAVLLESSLAEQPPKAYDDLARKAARACSGLPLALAVMGTHLWDQQDMKAWKHALAMLQTATPFGGGRLDDDKLLWGTLKLSFDTLNARERQMFLDIACFMLGRVAFNSSPIWGDMADSTLTHLRQRRKAWMRMVI